MALPHNQSTNDIVSEDEPIVKEEGQNSNEATSENHPVTLEVASEDPSNIDNVSTSSRPGLLSLPAEVRVIIFRHLLLENRPLTTCWAGAPYQPFPAILRVGRLFRREAFQVMYGENTFYISSMYPTCSILDSRQIHDVIQNVHIDVWLTYSSLSGASQRRVSFINTIREFGSPTITRGTLHIIFHVSCLYRDVLLNWFTTALLRFTNFRVVLIEYVDSITVGDTCRVLCNTHRDTCTPVFGPALSLDTGIGLEFHPQEYLNTILPEIDVDWMEYLDGIRLSWS